MRFEEIWDTPIVREYISSKSVLHDTLEYMRRKSIVAIERPSPKVTKVTLIVKLPNLLSKEVQNILLQAANVEETVRRLASNVEEKSLSNDEAYEFVYGLFVQSELERLDAIVRLLEVYRDPTLWPFLWWHLIQSLVVLPIIFFLQILRACEDTYPEATKQAVAGLRASLLRVLSSEQFKEYQRIFDSLNKPPGCKGIWPNHPGN